MTQATITTNKINYSIPAMSTYWSLPHHVWSEVIYGKLYILPPPKRYHQEIVGELFFELMMFAKATGVGKPYVQRTGVFLNDGGNAVEPDVLFRKHDNQNCIPDDRGLFGPPDLIIEVLSSNKKHDLVLKLDLYQQSGIKEYWVIDPITKESRGYLLQNDNTYNEPLIMNSKIHVRVLDKEISF
jgi:Uma2 family endonuclease